MCGIAGYIHFDKDRPANASLLEAMTGLINYRGPDDCGHYVSANVALGARRLSIIDIDGGHQPLSNEDGSCWVVYNGEVYNFRSLREDLVKRGHSFRTRCDTEVLIHSYEEYGARFVERLEGMFAFAIWDARARQLVLGRDRIGIKPLYYAVFDDTLIFGSEIKSILLYPGLERKADLNALNNILTFEYNPGPQTIFSGISKLPPGHVLVSDGRGQRLQRYWDLDASNRFTGGLPAAVERLKEELERAVKCHLMSDVPLGVFLSGGMDSSSIVSLMSRANEGKVKTFSIGFKDGEGYDELVFARRVAEHFRTEHHEYVLEPRAVEILPDLAWHLEEPIADEAAIPLYFLSSMAKDHVKVVLAGDGGDELFAGYNRYFLYHRVGRYKEVPRWLRHSFIEPLIRAVPWLPGNSGAATLVRRAKKLLEVAYQGEEERFSAWNRIFSEEMKAGLYSGDFLRAAKSESPFEHHRRHFAGSGFKDPMGRAQHVDLKTYLVDCLLLKSDKVTSAFSLECRVPLLDNRLVEYAASLPPFYKYSNGRSKHIMREAMRGALPAEIIGRGKRGFVLPFGRWFHDGLLGFAREVLLDRRAIERAYFNERGVRAMLETRSSDDRQARRLYSLLMFEMWNRVFIDSPPHPVRRTRAGGPSLSGTAAVEKR